jgi:hypothetical protein
MVGNTVRPGYRRRLKDLNSVRLFGALIPNCIDDDRTYGIEIVMIQDLHGILHIGQSGPTTCPHSCFWRSFHSFFCALAAFLFPKRYVDVCLSAPVFFDIYDEPANNI